MNNNWLLTLSNTDVDDLNLVGGKAYNLATLSRNNLSTPTGLILTTSFFEEQIKHYAYAPIWAGSPDVAVTEGALQFLADFLKSTPLAPQLQSAFQQALKDLFPPDIQEFAVRSSAVDEDQTDYTFAGCHLTELGVPRFMLNISLTRCWASALSGSAIQYRLTHGMSLQAIKIAVLIQPMVKAETSGVAFTLNPITGARDEFIIEATSGLGEALVSGRIKPYRYHLTRQAPLYPLQKKIVGDSSHLTREPLSTKQLATLGQMLDQLEALMGVPQDVEWSYQGDKFYILQARPITAIASVDGPPSDFELGFNTEWSRGNHIEILPETPSILFASLMQRTQNRAISFFNKINLDVSNIGFYLKIIYDRPYLNLTMIKRVLTQMGFSPEPLLIMAGYIESKTVSNPFSINWATVWQARESYFSLIAEILQLTQTIDNYQAMITEIIATLNNPPTTAAESLSQFKIRERVYGDLVETGLILVSALTGLMALNAKLLLPVVPKNSNVFAILGTLGKDPVAARYNLALLKLSHQALQEPQVLKYLNRGIYTGYQKGLAGSQFLIDFENYLHNYGNRAIYELDIGWPRFGDKPELLLKTINQYTKLMAQSNVDHLPTVRKKSLWETWRDLITGAKGFNRWIPWRQLLAFPFMGVLNYVFVLRNTMLTLEAKATAIIRKWDLALAERWVKANMLDAPDDYFWLTMEEIEHALVAEKDASIHLKPAAASRKAEREENLKIAVPFVIRDADIPAVSLSETTSPEILDSTIMGLPVSPGQVQGVVNFLQDFDSLDKVPKDTILVTPTADPAYFPYFPLACGLIIEIGGMLSHGSIIAREYGIPAVSNITNARTVLTPGDRVLLDGSTGVIQILERAKTTVDR